MRPLRRLTVLPTVPAALEPLRALARNLRWSWHPPTQELFAAMDAEGWEASGHNPLRMLNEADPARLEGAAADPGLLSRLGVALEDLDRYLTEPRWYQTLPEAPATIAYFSPEFGISEVMPQYSGGLGVLAGDHLKAASDLGVPLVGVGLFYRSGYFRQVLTADGRQQESYPAFNPHEVPIGHVTNGVHAGTWVSSEWTELFERQLGEGFADGGHRWDALDQVPDEEIWRIRCLARTRLVADVRRRLAIAWRAMGVVDGQLSWIDRAFDPDVLTVGFARRVPSYKRLTLLLRDQERLARLLLDPERPIQLLIAGKAHPADEGGKALIADFARFAGDAAVRHRIAFLPDYDMGMARLLVAGADVWLNNPLRPYEACGTSGMKAALNGCLNLSIRDGWWDELYDGANGWAIPSADEPSIADERRDELEAASIYDLLEHEILPLFHDRPDDGLPHRWIEMIRHNFVSLGPAVLASRMVRDYSERLYLPAAASSRLLRADGFAASRELGEWKRRVGEAWPGVAVRQVEADEGSRALGGRLPVRVVVDLGALSPDEGEVPLATSGAFGYTVRVVPRHHGIAEASELGLVTWA